MSSIKWEDVPMLTREGEPTVEAVYPRATFTLASGHLGRQGENGRMWIRLAVTKGEGDWITTEPIPAGWNGIVGALTFDADSGYVWMECVVSPPDARRAEEGVGDG